MWGTPQGMVYLATGHHDMRKSINGLALVVADTLGLDPTGVHWFVFCNRGRDRLKILHWDTNGFWLHCRRLEQGKVHWPKDGKDAQEDELEALDGRVHVRFFRGSEGLLASRMPGRNCGAKRGPAACNAPRNGYCPLRPILRECTATRR